MHCIPSASVAFRRSNRKTPADDTRLIKAEAAHILQPKCHLRPADELSARATPPRRGGCCSRPPCWNRRRILSGTESRRCRKVRKGFTKPKRFLCLPHHIPRRLCYLGGRLVFVIFQRRNFHQRSFRIGPMHRLAVVAQRLLREPFGIADGLGAFGPSVTVAVQRDAGNA